MRSPADNGPVLTRTIELCNGRGVGYLVIDSDLGGGGTGGIRMGEDVSLDEVAALASEMSHKFAWLNISRGGAKSGINCAGEISQADKLTMLDEFGQGIQDVLKSGQYIAGMDLGVGPVELGMIIKGAGMPPGEDPADESIDSNFYTALTVHIALTEALRHANRDWDQTSFLVEGLGKVARHLVRLISDEGGTITGLSTISGAIIRPDGIDVQRILELAESGGDRAIHEYDDGPVDLPSALFTADADVLIPGARVHGIHEQNVEQLQVSTVVPMANAAATSDAESAMFRNGVTYLPGFVTNSGGIFCWYLGGLEKNGRDRILRNGLGGKFARLIRDADRQKISISTLARQQVATKARRMRGEERGSPLQRILGTVRKFSLQRLPFVLARRILGKQWASRDSKAAQWYYNARYFS
ncbi:MAG: Glu/Leu/Phe/Val dehydrogenase dimerization domain-containing protein [Woeseiaceae bacterium]